MTEPANRGRGRPRKHPPKPVAERGRGRPVIPLIERPERFAAAVALWLETMRPVHNASRTAAFLIAAAATDQHGRLVWQPHEITGRWAHVAGTPIGRRLPDRQFNVTGTAPNINSRAARIRRAVDAGLSELQGKVWLGRSVRALRVLGLAPQTPDGSEHVAHAARDAAIGQLIALGWGSALPILWQSSRGLGPVSPG